MKQVENPHGLCRRSYKIVRTSLLANCLTQAAVAALQNRKGLWV